MTLKDRLHQLIEALPDSEIAAAERALEQLSAGMVDGEGMTAEDRAWLDSDLSGLGTYGPYDWGEEGPPATVNPVRYVPGRGLVVFLDEEVLVPRDQ